jgi:hypothetical protein
MEGRTPEGIPYLRPHGSLFFKAKYVRDKDQHDFDQVASTLSDDERAWLIAALDRYHPGHVWLASLASAAR